jgi:hypothetical protein
MARKKITTADLEDSANGKYTQARTINVPYDRDKIAQLADDVDQHLRAAPRGYREDLSGGTFRRVGELDDVAQQSAQPTFSDLEAKRQSLNTLRNDMWSQTGRPTAEASAADIAIKKIDQFLADPSNALPGFEAQATQTADLAKSARGDWAAMKRAQQVELAAQKGELNAATSGTGQNTENTLRQQMKAILVNPRRLAGYTPDQQSMIRDIAAGNVPRNTLRFISRLATTGVVSTGAVLYIAQHLGLGHLGEAGLAAVGAANLMGAKAAIRGRISGLLDSIRADSPLGQATLTQEPVGALGTALGKSSAGPLGKATLKGTIGQAALRASEQNTAPPPTQAPVPSPVSSAPMPGGGTRTAPFKATTQDHIDWFKNKAPPGTMIMIGGKLYTK